MEGIIFCSERAVQNSLPHKTRQDIGCFQSLERDRGSEIILHGGWNEADVVEGNSNTQHREVWPNVLQCMKLYILLLITSIAFAPIRPRVDCAGSQLGDWMCKASHPTILAKPTCWKQTIWSPCNCNTSHSFDCNTLPSIILTWQKLQELLIWPLLLYPKGNPYKETRFVSAIPSQMCIYFLLV